MKEIIKKTLKLLKKLFLWFFAFIAVYFIAAFVLSRITVNSKDKDPKKEVVIYLKSNGIHTDIALPVKNEIKDWSNEIKYSHTISNDSTMQFVAFGWGNKDFYLNTPDWSDLKFSTAFKAAFHIGSSAMHTQFYYNLSESERCRKIEISQEEYKKLVRYISESFTKENNEVQLISGQHYNDHDAFYEANGKYDLFNTCNSWTNCALKTSGQKAAVWALTDSAILRHYAD